MNDDQITELKKNINAFIFEHGPGTMTLEQAERTACLMLEAFLEAAGPPAEKENCGHCGWHGIFGKAHNGSLFCANCKHWKQES